MVWFNLLSACCFQLYRSFFLGSSTFRCWNPPCHFSPQLPIGLLLFCFTRPPLENECAVLGACTYPCYLLKLIWNSCLQHFQIGLFYNRRRFWSSGYNQSWIILLVLTRDAFAVLYTTCCKLSILGTLKIIISPKQSLSKAPFIHLLDALSLSHWSVTLCFTMLS